jgi:hypothetical protein
VTLTAAYSGDASYAPSTSSPASLQVTAPPLPGPAATTTTLALSKASVSYGDEQAETLSVQVAAPGDGVAIPTGSVTVKAGPGKLCTLALSAAGTATCTLKATTLLPGKVTLRAAYAGPATFAASTSAAATLTVAKEPTRTAVALSVPKVSYGAEQHERITVVVKPGYAGTPTGHVTVKAGSATLCVITLKSGKGGCSPAAAKLTVGRHKVSASYGGSADYTGSAAAAKTLTVTAPSPPPSAPTTQQGCYPLSNEGTCYEPGEYCRAADHGMTGIAGDGEAIICEDNDGWRWEPTG